MSSGAHAKSKSRGAFQTAARTSLIRTGAFAGALVVAWTTVSTLAGQGHLEAFAGQTDPPASSTSALPDKQVGKINALNLKYDCSYRGPGADVIPARAVVMVDNEVRLASFDEGWAIHLGDVPGQLVSLCAR